MHPITTLQHFGGVIALAMPCAMGVKPAFASHSAFVAVAHDPLLVQFNGSSEPTGPYQINFAGGAPGYLNGVSGGANGGSDGMVTVKAIGAGTVYLMGVAIHLTDAAGASHSLSTLGDVALSDIVTDLNSPAFGGDFIPLAYSYKNAPAQYFGAEAVLTAGETANGGQPFDILLVGTDPGPIKPLYFWSLGFSNEIGNLDGITALSVTDVGAVPEPATLSLMVVAGVTLLRRRQRAGYEPR